MGDCYITRRGGMPLNFKVKAYATLDELPASAPENTIAVITETPINGWIFAAKEPEAPVDGMLWIENSPESDFAFNALKKNTIQVYPLRAKQYVSGAWVSMTAYSYQGGEWVEWIIRLNLYDNGDECTDITGGWSLVSSKYSSVSVLKNPSVTKGAASITMSLSGSADSSTRYAGGIHVANDINFTKYTTLHVHMDSITCSGTPNSERDGFIVVTVVSRGAYWSADAVARYQLDYETVKTDTDVDIALDVSEIVGEYDIVVGIRLFVEKNSITLGAVIDEVYLK